MLRDVHLNTAEESPPLPRGAPLQKFFTSLKLQTVIQISVLVLCIISLALRFYRLGDLNFWADEDITALAVSSALENGLPQLPSGDYYFRSPITIYISAFFASLVGLSEFSLRIPSMLFSLGIGLLLFALGRRFFSPYVGLMAMLIQTVSFWDLEFARHARMYEAFAFFYLFAIYAISRGVLENHRSWMRISVIVSVATVFVHLLGGTLALLYFYLGMRRQRSGRNILFYFLASGIVGGIAFLQFLLIQIGFGGEAMDILKTAVAAVAAKAPLPMVYAGVLAAALFFGVSRFKPNARFVQIFGKAWLPLIALAAVAGDQTLAAMLVLIIYLLFGGRGPAGFSDRNVRLTISIIILGGIFQVLAESVGEFNLQQLGESLKAAFGYPKLYIIGFAKAFPVMTLVVILGAAKLILSTQRKTEINAGELLLAGFLLPLFANGFLVSKFVEYRLNFYLNPLFILLFSYIIYRVAQSLREYLASKKMHSRTCIVFQVATLGAFLIACEQIGPRKLSDVLRRNYGDIVNHRTAPGSRIEIMPDHAGAAAFVAENAAPDDVVIAVDLLAQSQYLDRVDYWLRTKAYLHQSKNGAAERVDIYTGTPILSSLAMLQQVIENRGERRIFVITAPAYMKNPEHLSQEVLGFLENLEKNCVFRGKDRRTGVYLIPNEIMLNVTKKG